MLIEEMIKQNETTEQKRHSRHLSASLITHISQFSSGTRNQVWFGVAIRTSQVVCRRNSDDA